VDRVNMLRRVAALTGASTIALLAAVAPANADAVKAVFQGDARGGEGVFMAKPGHNPPHDAIHTSLFALKTETGEILKTYCVDFNTPTYDHANYDEVPWASHDAPGSSFKANAAKINWILHNSYPQVDPDDLQAAVKKAIPDAKFSANGLSDAEAIAATQAAAWHFSDGMDLDKNNPTEHGESKDDVQSLYAYLTSDKINKGLTDQPKPELTLTPQKLAGKAGSLIGPFTVATNAPDVVVSAKLPEGVQLTDKDGKQLPDAAAAAKKAMAEQGGGKYDFYVKVPAAAADGKAELTVKGKAQLTLGRLFAVTKGRAAQRMILAEAQNVALETKGEASWNAAGTTTPPTTDTPVAPAKNTEELANTGASIMTPVLIGVVLVAGGVGALVFQRKRRKV
jgi:TQXA domain-containing protein/LPXTG-motif cell wall-anchored protein